MTVYVSTLIYLTLNIVVEKRVCVVCVVLARHAPLKSFARRMLKLNLS